MPQAMPPLISALMMAGTNCWFRKKLGGGVLDMVVSNQKVKLA
jgi:hypothetical protein